MEIKICGIRRKEDIDIISKYKPDYIGFIFAKSKREVTPETVAEITKNLDKDIKKVGVFVNATYEKINEADRQQSLTLFSFTEMKTMSIFQTLTANVKFGKP